MALNEADTRAKLIEPKLKAAGWTDQQMTREFYYQRDVACTPGKIILVGDRVRRGQGRKVDYLLHLTEGFPIAVVEAEPEYKSADAGLEQAKSYARDLGMAFAYSTNGHKIVEHGFFTNATRELDLFPRPQELWYRWRVNTSPIRDEHFDEARRLWKAWDAYRKGKGPREACLSERSWIVSVEEVKNRGYDLTARNPNRSEGEKLPSPAEIVAGLPKKEREILSIMEELNECFGNNWEAPDG